MKPYQLPLIKYLIDAYQKGEIDKVVIPQQRKWNPLDTNQSTMRDGPIHGRTANSIIFYESGGKDD